MHYRLERPDCLIGQDLSGSNDHPPQFPSTTCLDDHIVIYLQVNASRVKIVNFTRLPESYANNFISHFLLPIA